MRLNEQGFMMREGMGEEIRQEVVPLLRDGIVTYGYRELPQAERGRLDVLEQLKANIQHIEELNGKLSFLLKEVQSVLKKS